MMLAIWPPSLALATCGNTTVPTGDVTYAYDPDGRLVGVLNSAGSAASYQYDAVGDLLSITRPTAAVSILALSPYSGPTSTCVTIYGKGFSSTPGQNTVTFDGTAASVSYATPTSIVVPSRVALQAARCPSPRQPGRPTAQVSLRSTRGGIE
jgi:YD repeat-containing protein